MSKRSILPSRVWLEQIIYSLNLNEVPRNMAIRCIFEHLLDDNLRLFFDTEVTGSENLIFDDSDFDIDFSTSFTEEPSTEAKTKIPTTPIIKRKPYVINGVKEFYSRNDYPNYLYDNYVEITAFIQDKRFYSAQDEDRDTYYPHIYYEDIYCDGIELQSLIDSNIHNATTSNKTMPDTSKGKISKQDRREDAFKQWLKTVTKVQVTKESHFQECYLELNEPTRESIWKDLKLVDNRLFSSGKDDFFKKQKIIKFTKGTGENRYKQS